MLVAVGNEWVNPEHVTAIKVASQREETYRIHLTCGTTVEAVRGAVVRLVEAVEPCTRPDDDSDHPFPG